MIWPLRAREVVRAADEQLSSFIRPRPPVRPLQRALRDTMWETCGVVRDQAGLEHGLELVAQLRQLAREVDVRPTSDAQPVPRAARSGQLDAIGRGPRCGLGPARVAEVMLRSVAADPAPSRSARRLEREEGVPVQIAVVGPADLAELQPLMRAYCDFCQVAPGDQTLLELSQALLADPQPEGLQLLARDDTGRAVGFATLFWTWQTAVDNHRAQAVCERIGATRDDRWLDYQLPVDPG